MKIKILKFIKNFKLEGIWLILSSSFILRLFLANFGTLALDQGTFISWANQLATEGFATFYSGWSDYLPGYLYILWILGKINIAFPALQTLIFKLPAILTDILTGLVIYKVAKQSKGEKWGLTLTAIYVFNPAIISNSTLWGQVDSLTAFFALLSIYFFPNSYLLSSIFLSLGTLIKPQAAFILPAILYLFIRHKKKFSEILIYCITGLLVFAAGFMPFNSSGNLINFIFERLQLSAGQYPYGSVNAFSFWGLFGFWKPDNITSWLGIVVSVVSILVIFLKLFKRKNCQYLLAGICLLITFMFLTRMHERHLLPVLAPILLSTLEIFPLLLVYGILSLTYIANLAYAYFWITDNFKEIFNPVIIKFLILGNLSAVAIFLLSLFNKKTTTVLTKLMALKQIGQTVLSPKKLFKSRDISSKSTKILLIVIISLTIFSRLFGLGYPKEEYFDEVYHVFTAKLMLHNDPKAWEWWNPHPEGFAYEWTHPPLAKLGMAGGMMLFGENAFGSRAIQAILGTVAIYLLYLITEKLFKDRKMAILASAVLALDGLFLVMNRIGMNDTYMVFFMLLSLFFFIKEKNFLSAVSLGLALASKWSALYFIPILGISHFVLRKKFVAGYAWFFIIPILVYIGSYLQMFTTGHTWDQFIEVQKQMWWYHTTLDADHPYTSPAWTWPILVRPIYLYNGPEVNGWVDRIYAFGNPMVFWFGLFSLIYSIIIAWKEKIKNLGFVIFSYLIFFIPWIASPRIMFLYHYLPSLPFLAILTGFVLRRFSKLVFPFFITAVILFIYFYPHWTAIKIPEGLDLSYYWFDSWR